MAPLDPGSEWHVRVIGPRLPWGAHPPRAAEVGEALSAAMLSNEYALEDAEFQKIVPNDFVVELHEVNYLRNYQPIEERVLGQWRTMMLEQLGTANSRQGRNLYQLGAPLRLAIHPVSDLEEAQARILCRVQYPRSRSSAPGDAGRPTLHPAAAPIPCLELASGGRRWPLRSNIITIGRDERCDVFLDMPEVQDRRLVSSEHAYLRYEQGRYLIYDGSSDGRSSVNGTYVNRQPVPASGRPLEDNDEIILASLDKDHPQPDAPGVITLRFRRGCS